jgi:DNA repair photolyase
LVRRDFDLLLKYKDQVRLGTSLPHLDDNLAKVLEPKAPAPTARLEMLREAAQLGIPVYRGGRAIPALSRIERPR